MRLTAASLGAQKLDTDVTDKIFFDTDVPGFGLRVRASGGRTWIFQYKVGGRTRRLVLGNASAVKPARAREIASELHAKVRLGGDPAAEKRESVRRSQDTFGNLIERFLEQYRRRPCTPCLSIRLRCATSPIY
jgi:Arm DNA-binding domain